MKKQPSEKVAKIKSLFEKAGVEIEDNQVQSFLTTFELQKKEAIEEAVKPLQAKLEEYQKRNFSLAGALEEAKQFKSVFEKSIDEKIKQLESIKLPSIPKIEDSISKLLNEKLNLFEKKIAKLDEAVNKINEKVLPLKMEEDIKKITDIGNVFNNYKQEFAKHLVDVESSEIKKLKEEVALANNRYAVAEKKTEQLQKQVLKERENTEITLLLENSPLDAQEKEHMYKYYQKLGYEEGKTEIEKFISTKELKEREKPVQRSFVRESSGGVKPMNETGILQKKRLLGESTSFSREIDEWAKAAGIDDSEQV